jgi:hypothetical protein
MALTASKITKVQLESCCALYQTVVQKAYEARIKNVDKRKEAFTRDRWRYDELPKEVEGGKGLTLAQLERLVQWKM